MTFQFGAAGILGLCLAGAGAGLYLLRSTRPELARDYDIFFSAIALLCGGILFFNGWRLDPILMFGQVLMAGSAVFFAFDSIRLRSITTDQAKRGGGRQPIVDDERDYPVDQVYRAELDEIEPYMEDRPPVRRIRGSRDSEAADRAAYQDSYSSSYSADSYSSDPYSSPSDSYSSPGYSERSSRRSSRRRPRPERTAGYGSSAYDASFRDRDDYQSSSDSYSDDYVDAESRSSSSYTSSPRRPASNDWESSLDRNSSSDRSRRSSSSRRRSGSSRDRYYDDESATSRRRPRSEPSRDSRTSRDSKDDYVDYKPIGNYADSSSSSTYGSRRPSRDYDDEWGAS
ncbi:MAG: Ycf66 family protein [Cyanobacteria bacterium P01_F01_bin.42]